ncbi:MAG: DNA polymerase/3'-5' exonuclease PolX [Chitinophagales bacterium]
MENRKIAGMFETLANALEILGENQFKIRAYRSAARTIYNLDEDVEDYWREGRLQQIPGVGKAIQDKIGEIIETGDLRYLRDLYQRIPEEVVSMLAIPGLGPRTIGIIYQSLGITSIEDLVQAAKERKIRRLPGLGAKTEYNILKGIDLLKAAGESVTLGVVLPLADDFCSYLNEGTGIVQAQLVGSIRRRKPVVNDVDILVAANNQADVEKRVSNYRSLKQVTEIEPDVIRGQMGPGFRFEVITVKPGDFPLAFLLATGSKEHRQVLLELMAESGLTAGESEKDIYNKLGLEWIPPELRENRGEIDMARNNALPHLVDVPDIKGDLHIHTDWSDGAQNLEQMVETARALGYSYIAITEHSKSLAISRGLNEERLKRQTEYIKELNTRMKDFTVLTGIEVDILKDGSLDLPDDILKDLDVVIASIHSHFPLSQEEQTGRIISAIRNPQVDIIGHLTGRLLNRRPGYQVDVDKVLEEAAKNQTALEINAHPDRLDVSEENARKAREQGVKIIINSDAHHAGDMLFMKYGVFNARRGWLEVSDVLNTGTVNSIREYFGNKAR